LLEELEGNQDLLDRLSPSTISAPIGLAEFHVRKWVEQWRKGEKIVWRLKVWDLENGRA
jgi:hypothetical protein